MQISRQEILLHDLVQTDPDKALRYSPEEALLLLKAESEFEGNLQDFCYDAEKWKEWLLAHFPHFKRWMEHLEELLRGSL